MAGPNLKARRYYLNRELSWLAFNERVLALAERPDVPLLERLKFLAIAASNLDEFYMVRIGGLEREADRQSSNFKMGPDGLSLAEVLSKSHAEAKAIAERIESVLGEQILPALADEEVQLLAPDKIDAALDQRISRYYLREVHPTLTPIAVDSAHPFPVLRSGTLNLALRVTPGPNGHPLGLTEAREGPLFAVVQVPSVLPRFVSFPEGSVAHRFVTLEHIIARNVSELFPGHEVLESAVFRLTRSSDLDFAEEEAVDLLSTIKDELRRRFRGDPVRLELDASASDALTRDLLHRLEIEPRYLQRRRGLVAVADLMKVYAQVEFSSLKDPGFNPLPSPRLRYAHDLFGAIADGDILLHHPYDSFRHVIDFIEQAANDPHVVAIKQTLYRTSGDSPIVRALTRAAEQGKDVTAIVEIKARFDEANNIAWAKRLEESGVHVVYGMIGFKTHSKMLLVTRREGDGLRRYLHLGTGNYHPSTARLYTDLGLFTAREDITHDAMLLFNVLTGYAELPELHQLVVAPFNLRQHILERIEIEIEHARAGQPAGLIAKMNSLVDGEIIEALYRASGAGVQIDLIVRGICCLRPGLDGVSENIRVRSILDRFLEHSRVFWWQNGGDDLLYLSSADWMPRNLNRRIECCFPVLDPELKARVLDEILPVELADNTYAWDLDAGGEYHPLEPGEASPRRAQVEFIELAMARSKRRLPGFLPELRVDAAPITPVMRALAAQERRRNERS